MDDETRSEVFLRNITDDDCGVIAFQAITGTSRKRAMELLRNAYVKGQGTFRSKLSEALVRQGYNLTSKPIQPGEHTIALFSATYDHGTFLLWQIDHVCVQRDGDLLNPTGWNEVIVAIDEVTR